MVEYVTIYDKEGKEHSLAAIDARAALKHPEWSLEKPKAEKPEPKAKKAEKPEDAETKQPPVDNDHVADGAEKFDDKTIEKNSAIKS